MSFSYGPANAPPTWDPVKDAIRLLISDTDQATPIFQDEEIAGAVATQANMFLPTIIGGRVGAGTASALPVSPLRVAALLMDALSSNQSKLQSVTKLLDVSLSPLSAKEMRAQAAAWRQLDDESAGIVMIEVVSTSFSFRDRWFSEWMRNGQGMGGAA